MSRDTNTPTTADLRKKQATLRKRKARLHEEGRGIHNRAERERRDLRPAEEERFWAILAEVERLVEEIEAGTDLLIRADRMRSPRAEAWRRRMFAPPL